MKQSLNSLSALVQKVNFIQFLFGLMALGVSFYAEAKTCEGHACQDAIPLPAPQAVDASALDVKADPCQDFYQYACGGWIEKTEIPEDRAQWSRGFTEIDERNLNLLRTVLSDYSVSRKNPPQNPYVVQMGDYYGMCTDEKKAETASLKTLKDSLKDIEDLKEKADLMPLIADLQMMGVNALFDFSSEQDLKDPNLMIGAADQAGLGLPDRDYYLKNDAKMQEIRKQYQEHLKKMFTLLKWKPAQADKASSTVFNLEKSLAEVSMDRVERRDPDKVYHRLEKSGLKKLAPDLNWDLYFQALGYPHVKEINVRSPEFFKGLNKIVTTASLDDLKTYLRWHLLHTSAGALGKKFVDQEFQFYSKTLSGQKALAPRWKRCVQSTVGAMGMAVGRSFVEVSYGESGKKISKKMISDIEEAFRSNLKDSKWMDGPTREEALKKLDRIFNKVGYPDHWRSYSGMNVGRQSYLKNRFSANVFNSKYELDKIGKPVDRGEWLMPPSMVNAYYDPSMNEMVFPAGILQDPFFDARASSEANYGGIGMVMGHELTHGFDDEGRKFDSTGKLRDWWSPKVSKEFDERAECVIKQYDSYTVGEGLHVNGKLTAGENLADLGGIKTAYAAWQNSLPKSSGVPGESDQKKFFIHFAQTWCTKTKPEFERLKITVDPHSPPKMRVNGPLADFPEFGKTFSCAEGTPMNPKNRCTVW